jgi:hypothetical protein
MLSWQKNLQLYLDNNKNVLLEGEYGTGKTSIIKQLFNKNFGDEWLYLAGGTCEPFIDLLGIPRPIKDSASGKEVLEFIKPKKLQLNKVKAIFCDEFNRAKSQVKNGLMEIIQFKSLNNEPVPNLRVVWCANNPNTSDYNIEQDLDFAQRDRFHIQISVPYLLDIDYFDNKFGKDMSEGCQEWWNQLDNTIKKLISPRRLEYAIEVYQIKGDLTEVLPPSANISKLISNLEHGSISGQIEKMLKEDEQTVIKKMKDTNIVTAIKEKLDNPNYVKKFLHLLPEEIINEKAPSNPDICSYIKENTNKFKTSTISTLHNMGCFSESDFSTVFTAYNKYFASNTYNARNRNKIVKMLSYLPDLNKSKIHNNDVPNLQKVINITNEYCGKSNYNTVLSDNSKYDFLRKFRDINSLNEIQKLGLNLKAPIQSYKYYYDILYWIGKWETNEAASTKKDEFVSVSSIPKPIGTITVSPGILRGQPIIAAPTAISNQNHQTWVTQTNV